MCHNGAFDYQSMVLVVVRVCKMIYWLFAVLFQQGSMKQTETRWRVRGGQDKEGRKRKKVATSGWHANVQIKEHKESGGDTEFGKG